jgi:hypothetical protein
MFENIEYDLMSLEMTIRHLAKDFYILRLTRVAQRPTIKGSPVH